MSAALPPLNANDIAVRLPDRRLVASVLAALALHLLLLGLIRMPPERAPSGLPPLILQWRMPLSHEAKAPEPDAAFRPPATGGRHDALSAPTTNTPGSGATAPNIENDGAPPAMPATAELLDSAHRLVRRYAHERLPGEQPPGAPLADRPVLPELDRALREPVAEEKRLASGIIKVTTAFGATYCLKPPPEISRSGPMEALAVPTTCP